MINLNKRGMVKAEAAFLREEKLGGNLDASLGRAISIYLETEDEDKGDLDYKPCRGVAVVEAMTFLAVLLVLLTLLIKAF